MCGICGVYLWDSEKTVEPELLNQMNQQMLHRGPDAGAIFNRKNIGLGHRRLKIIDLNGGAQPMLSEDEQIALVFNGEIYNYKALRQELIAKGYTFDSKSDTEVVLKAYMAWGTSFLERLRGMFGIAIYDFNKNRLVVARDRLGIKPIYYITTDIGIYFSSEIKPLRTASPETKGVNLGALDMYMTVGYVPGEDTAFNGIKKLEPGHLLVVENGKQNIQPYWELKNKEPDNKTFDETLLEFETLLKETVKLHLASDVPLGAFLSGGVDSSALVALMSEVSDEPVKTFSVGYKDEPEASELKYAAIVAKQFNTDHHEFFLEPTEFFNSLDMLLEFSEEPIVESAAVALYQLSLLAKEHVTVILSGEGGDEILSGYPLYQIMPKVDKLFNFLRLIPSGVNKSIGSIINNEKYSKYWDWMTTPLAQRYMGISNDVTPSIKRKLYSENFLVETSKLSGSYFQSAFENLESASDLQRMAYTDFKGWLPDDLLVKADKMTMAASLELRVPFLDHERVEYTFSLPDNFRINEGQGKYLLKKLLEKKLPKEIIYRKKQGFPVPISKWFRGELYGKLSEILLDNVTISRGYFNKKYIERMLTRHKAGTEDHSRRLLTILILELWHRKYID